jgi:hypothetical protein
MDRPLRVKDVAADLDRVAPAEERRSTPRGSPQAGFTTTASAWFVEAGNDRAVGRAGVVGDPTVEEATRESEKPPEPEGPSDFSSRNLPRE